MAKGGFLSALLADRNASSTSGFAWRSLYYIYIGIPLLALYYLAFHILITTLAQPLMTVLGFGFYPGYHMRVQEAITKAMTTGDVSDLASLVAQESWALGFIKLALVVLLYHLGALDSLLAPVYYITKV